MDSDSIQCRACGWSGNVGRSLTVYEQQRMEGSPCPGCGSLTLAYVPTQLSRRQQLANKRRQRYQIMASPSFVNN
ncbi:hypothetical protein [Tuwongella immobilis]|uniref:hypothetical protein n=1 Tax=Tuwongella immobilis TaxID=692036 RepID=UPI0013A706C1|nr:hypothetical protein [Tuwongella immobilis]